MRNHLILRKLPFALLLAFVGCHSDWRRIESSECGFTVRVPGPPALGRRVLTTSRGAVEFQWWKVEVPRHILRSQTFINSFQAGCAVLPMAIDDRGGREEIERAIARELGSIRTRRAVTISSQPATELTIDAGPVTYVVDLLFRNGKVYELSAARSGNMLLKGTEATFFDSFALLP